jgi:Capsular polysaccharide synthesis protein
MKSRHTRLVWIGVIILFIIITFLHIEGLRRREAFQDAGSYELPKIIWTHWHSDNPPAIVKKNIEGWREKLEPLGWTINLLSDSTIANYVDEASFPKNVAINGPTTKANVLRLRLLRQYGGVWMDSGFIVNNPDQLETMYTKSLAEKSELTGYYIASLTSNDRYKVIENYFIMAPKGSQLIEAWIKEYEHALDVGFFTYKRQLRSEGVDTQRIYQHFFEVYLTQAASMQAVLQKRLQREPVVILERAEDTVFKLHSDCKWDKTCLQKKLRELPVSEQPGLVKLRKIDR